MKKVFDFFDKIIYINLDERKDRKASMETLFNKYGIKATRFPATSLSKEENIDLLNRGIWYYDDTRPEYAPRIKSTTLSHLQALFYSDLIECKNVLVFEDDVEFVDDILGKLSTCIQELKGLDWDIFYLGNQPFEAEQVTPTLAKVNKATSAHAYCVNGKYIKTAIKAVNFKPHPVIDTSLGSLGLLGGNIYMSVDELVYQKPDISDIEGVYVNLREKTKERYRDNIIKL